jgi:hypothetical protein
LGLEVAVASLQDIRRTITDLIAEHTSLDRSTSPIDPRRAPSTEDGRKFQVLMPRSRNTGDYRDPRSTARWPNALRIEHEIRVRFVLPRSLRESDEAELTSLEIETEIFEALLDSGKRSATRLLGSAVYYSETLRTWATTGEHLYTEQIYRLVEDLTLGAST